MTFEQIAALERTSQAQSERQQRQAAMYKAFERQIADYAQAVTAVTVMQTRLLMLTGRTDTK